MKEKYLNNIRGFWQDPLRVKNYIEVVRGGLPFAAFQIELMLFIMRNSGRRIRRFADLGCGNGILSGALLFEYPDAEGVLVDISDMFLREARDQLKEYSKNIELVKADLGTSKWVQSVVHKARFDAIISGFTISCLSHERKKRLYGEIFDLLQPGGIFLNIDLVSSPTGWVKSVAGSMMVNSVYDYAKSKNLKYSYADIVSFINSREKVLCSYPESVELQCGWLGKCGFSEIGCYFKVFELAVFGGIRPREGIIRRAFKFLRG